MIKRKKHPGILFINILIFLILFLIHYTDGLSIKILNANPFPLLPLIIAFSMFNDELPSAVAGLVVGIFIDSSASSVISFNAITMMLIALMSSFISHYLFNINIRSALALTIIFSLLYFVLRGLLFFTLSTTTQNATMYFLEYGLPSVIYTVIFVIPFFYIERRFFKIRSS